MTADVMKGTMFSKDHGVRAFVDGERVGCPLRGVDVDIDECLGCRKLLRLVDDERPYILCDPWRTDPVDAGFDRYGSSARVSVSVAHRSSSSTQLRGCR